MIPQHFIQDLLSRVDLAELIARYVPLKRSGTGFLARCPFHEEKTPSFHVNPVKQFYHCFGCGASGTAISFLMDHAGLPFPEAVAQLAQTHGLTVPNDHNQPEDQRERLAKQQERHDLIATLQKAQNFYRAQLKQSESAKNYLRRRGLTGAIAQQFGLGYAPAPRQSLKTVFDDYNNNTNIVTSGLVALREDAHEKIDRFRDRITFPIHDARGDLIGFGGRSLGDIQPKYLNSPETPLFSKSHEVYGLYQARQAIRKAGHVLICEGYMDVVALAQAGFGQAVATLGTAIGENHTQQLLRHTDRLVFCFDGDAAGQKAAFRALDICLPYLNEQRRFDFVVMPSEHDPDSFVRQEGQEAFHTLINQALPASKMLIRALRKNHDLDTVEGHAAGIAFLRPLYQKIPNGSYRAAMLRALSDELRVHPAELEHELKQQHTNPYTHSQTTNQKTKLPTSSRPAEYQNQRKKNRVSTMPSGGSRTNTSMLQPERRAACLLLMQPNLAHHCKSLAMDYTAQIHAAVQEGQDLEASMTALSTLLELSLSTENHSHTLAQTVELFRHSPHFSWVRSVLSETLNSTLHQERLMTAITTDESTVTGFHAADEFEICLRQCWNRWVTLEMNRLANLPDFSNNQEEQQRYRSLGQKKLVVQTDALNQAPGTL